MTRSDKASRLSQNQVKSDGKGAGYVPVTRTSLQSICDSSPDIIVRVDREGNRLFMNKAIEKYTGKPPSWFIGKTIFDSFGGQDPELPKLFQTNLNSVFETGRSVNFEFRARTVMGPRWFQSLVVPERGADGKVGTVLSYVRDVTRLKEVEEALLESERTFRQLAENIDQVFWLMSGNTMIYVSPAYDRLWGRSRDEVYQSPDAFIDSAHPDDRERVRDAYAQCMNHGSCTVEYRIIRPDNTQRWIRARGFPIAEDGTLVRTAGFAEDITESRAVEDELKRREMEYRLIFENMPEMVVRYDRNCRRIYVSPALAKAYGVNAEDLLGTSPDDTFIAQDESSKISNQLREIFRTGEPRTMELRIPGEDRTVWHQIQYTPEFSEDGTVETILGVGRDISEIKEAQLSLKQAHDKLESRVRKRTEELEQTNRRLLEEIIERKKAQDDAQRANLAKSEFLANMSHEIRTPVSGILGVLEMMADKELSDDLQNDIQIVRESAGSLIHLINDLLDLSRIEFGKLELNREDFNLHELLQGVVASFASQIRKKDLTLELSIGPGVPEEVRGDAQRIAQVLRNLISNGIKFTEQGEVRLEVGTTGQGSDLMFSVRDTGIGIQQERIGELFQSFCQLDASFSKHHEGAGLGLIISKELVQRMGGEIGVDSVFGRGSTFFFTLSLPESRTKSTRSVREIREGLEDLAALPPLRILLAEDNRVNRYFLCHFLRRAGHEVVSVENGYEALDVLAGESFDLVLMDIQMPGMDGIEVTRNVRSHGSPDMNRQVPIIALTAYAMKGDRDRFMESGMNGYVSKPVEFSELARVIADVLVH